MNKNNNKLTGKKVGGRAIGVVSYENETCMGKVKGHGCREIYEGCYSRVSGAGDLY